jgi:hypothetical protein
MHGYHRNNVTFGVIENKLLPRPADLNFQFFRSTKLKLVFGSASLLHDGGVKLILLINAATSPASHAASPVDRVSIPCSYVMGPSC